MPADANTPEEKPGDQHAGHSSGQSDGQPVRRAGGRPLLAIAGGIAIVGAVLLLTFRWAEHRAGSELLLRYCDDPQRHLTVLRGILIDETADTSAERRSRMVAAKLLFTEPRRAEEPVEIYIERLDARLKGACG